jgi:magnesium-transporting ATPase (P-type)
MLRPLLLFHGRTNNIRISGMILYFFYKNFVFTLSHFYFAFYNNFSGQTIYDDWYITLFNLIFTSLPLMIRAGFDHDVKPDDGSVIYEMMPFLYEENRTNSIFNIKTFLLALGRGILHGLINFFFILFATYDNSIDSHGNMIDLWYLSCNIFTNVIFVNIF